MSNMSIIFSILFKFDFYLTISLNYRYSFYSRMRRTDNWFEQHFDTPEKKAKLHVLLTYGMIISWIMIVIGIVLFILIVAGIIHA
jgi:hypothetical protein